LSRAFLHIGYPKAGSSAIQTTLLASRLLLRERGYFFPRAPSGLCNAFTAHFHYAPETLFPYCEMPDAAGRQAAMREDFAELEGRIGRNRRRSVVLSSESLIDLPVESVSNIRDWLAERFDAVTVICYVRHPIPYASSLIQERVKQGATLEEMANFRPTGRAAVFINTWARVFGRENMRVRPLDREQLCGGDVVADFLDLIGYTGPIDQTAVYENASLSQATVLLLSAINGLPPPLREKARQSDWIKDIPGPAFRLPATILKEIAEASRRHLNYLASEWGIRFAPIEIGAAECDGFGPEALAFLARKLASI
jgi:hypothetical protein